MTDTPDQPAKIPGVQPALTREQWGRWHRDSSLSDPYVFTRDGRSVCIDDTVAGADRHLIGALCLYGTPEGFTHDELEAMTILVKEAERSYVFRHNGEDGEALVASALAKIAALLPPKSLP